MYDNNNNNKLKVSRCVRYIGSGLEPARKEIIVVVVVINGGEGCWMNG